MAHPAIAQLHSSLVRLLSPSHQSCDLRLIIAAREVELDAAMLAGHFAVAASYGVAAFFDLQLQRDHRNRLHPGFIFSHEEAKENVMRCIAWGGPLSDMLYSTEILDQREFIRQAREDLEEDLFVHNEVYQKLLSDDVLSRKAFESAARIVFKERNNISDLAVQATCWVFRDPDFRFLWNGRRIPFRPLASFVRSGRRATSSFRIGQKRKDLRISNSLNLEQTIVLTAYHEGGHLLSARHFGGIGFLEIWVSKKGWCGPARTPHSGIEPFEKSCVGWAGALAELLSDNPDLSLSAFMRKAQSCHRQGSLNVSPTDRVFIKSHAHHRKAFELAARLVHRYRDELRQIAAKASKTLIKERQSLFLLR